MKIYGIIYKIENLVNGKVYIGQTTRKFNERYYGHGIEGVYKYYQFRKEDNSGYNDHLYKAINKYGFNNFKVIEQFDVAFSKTELDIKERTYIKLYNSTNRKYGYNYKDGGSYGKHSKESKIKMSIANKGRFAGNKNPMYGIKLIGNKNGMYGKHHTEETKIKISESCKGRTVSEGQRQKQSERLKGIKFTEEHKKKISESLKGRTFTDEHKKHIGETSKGRKHTKETKLKMIKSRSKAIIQLTINGDYIREWDSAKQAEIEGGFTNSNICVCCKGKRKSYKGYKWMYKTEYIKLKEEA